MDHNDSDASNRLGSPRRTFIKGVAAAGVLAGMGNVMSAQEQATEYEFGGRAGGWQGRAPPAIEGTENPTLELEPGTTYTVLWENLDGLPHNFVVIDGDGQELVRSEVIEEQGATQTVEFEATEGMAEYFCEYHPARMRGEIDTGVDTGDGEEERIPQGDSVGLQMVAEGLAAPLALEVAPGETDRRYVVDQPGQIYVHDEDGLRDEPFLDVSDRLVELGHEALNGYDERGLLGLAFHPDYQNNGTLYVRYSAPVTDDGTDGVGGDDSTPDGESSPTPTEAEPSPTPADESPTETPVETEDSCDRPASGDGHGTNETDANGTAANGAGTNGTEANGTETSPTEANGTETNATDTNGDTPDGGEADGAGKGGQPEPGYDHVEVLSEFTVMEGGDRVDPDSERRILEIPSPQSNHDGGAVAFGPDGYLYISMGDGGDADDTGPGHVDDWYDANEGGNGQDTSENLLGGILRIDVDSESEGRAYGIPEDNPLVDMEGHLDEYYAWGFRNPWRMSFDSEGRLFVGDAGQNLYEEVDIVEKGGNYGWNVKEGTHCFSTEDPTRVADSCPDRTPDDVRGGEPLLDPIIEYRHRESTTAFIDGSVVIGGYVYESDTVPALEGQYVFGNWSGTGVRNPDGEIFVASPDDDTAAETPTEEEESLARVQAQAIELGGEIQAWMGRAPAEIEGEENPTLSLTPGQSYAVTWENVDGAPHNFVVVDGDGEELVRSEIISESGATQTVEFEATEAMAEYLCEVHPTTMRGQIQLEAADGTETATETETETATETETETATATETGTETATGTETPTEPSDGESDLWSIEELVIEGTDDGTLGEYVYAFGRDSENELYVMTSENYTPFGDTGRVYKLVPPEEGDDIGDGEASPTPDGDEESPTTDDGASPTPDGEQSPTSTSTATDDGEDYDIGL